jgi:hypothetical protein
MQKNITRLRINLRFFDAIGQGRFMLISQVNPANGLFERELFGA